MKSPYWQERIVKWLIVLGIPALIVIVCWRESQRLSAFDEQRAQVVSLKATIEQQRQEISKFDGTVRYWQSAAFDTLYFCEEAKEERDALRQRERASAVWWKRYGSRVVMVERSR